MGSVGEGGKIFCNQPVLRHCCETLSGANPEAFLPSANAFELAQSAQRYQVTRRKLATLHLRINIRTAGDHHRIGT
jgi:hypothetical protein